MATVVVRDGTLKVGDFLVAGSAIGKVKALMAADGSSTSSVGVACSCVATYAFAQSRPFLRFAPLIEVKTAGPSEAVEIMGWREMPPVGAPFVVKKNEVQACSPRGRCVSWVFVFTHTHTPFPQICVQKEARADAEEIARLQELEEAKEEWKEMDQTRREASKVERESKASLPWYARRKKKAVKRVSEDELYSHDKPRQSIIIKGDVQGSIEAICDMLEALPSKKGERTY